MDSNTIVAREQAFGQAGNWGEGKPKRPLRLPLSLPFPRYVFLQTESLFTG